MHTTSYACMPLKSFSYTISIQTVGSGVAKESKINMDTFKETPQLLYVFYTLQRNLETLLQKPALPSMLSAISH